MRMEEDRTGTGARAERSRKQAGIRLTEGDRSRKIREGNRGKMPGRIREETRMPPRALIKGRKRK